MGKEYVTALRARGISERKIFFSHLLPGALTPVLTLAGMSVGSLLGGAAIVETIFGWPGIGSMVVDAIRVRDYPVIQGYVLWMAAIYLLAGLVTDLFCRMLDPRQRRKALWRKLAHRPEDVPGWPQKAIPPFHDTRPQSGREALKMQQIKRNPSSAPVQPRPKSGFRGKRSAFTAFWSLAALLVLIAAFGRGAGPPGPAGGRPFRPPSSRRPLPISAAPISWDGTSFPGFWRGRGAPSPSPS